MNNEEKIATAILATGVVVATVSTIKNIRKERQKRREINAKTDVEIHCIRVAADRLHEKLSSGDYRPTSIAQLMDDFEFEKIAAHYE